VARTASMWNFLLKSTPREYGQLDPASIYRWQAHVAR